MNVRKSDDATDREATHRLTDIDVDEVSLVDRAANGRRYTVVKAEDGAAGDGEGKPEEEGNEPADAAKDADATEGEGANAGDKGDSKPDSAAKDADAEDDPAEGDAAAEGDDGAEEGEPEGTGKGAPAHAALAEERLGALKADVEAMLSMAASDPDKASEIYWRAHRHLTAYRDLVDVAAVSKGAEATAAKAVIEPLMAQVNAEIAKAEEGEGEMPEGDAPENAPDPMAAVMDLGREILAEMKALNAHFSAATEAQADADKERDDAVAAAKAETASVVKALDGLRATVAKLERAPSAPNSRGSERPGSERGGERPPEAGWTDDLAREDCSTAAWCRT